jgi:hypothetical protein
VNGGTPACNGYKSSRYACSAFSPPAEHLAEFLTTHSKKAKFDIGILTYQATLFEVQFSGEGALH